MTPADKSPRGRLFIMMALEFFIWGAWLPLIFGYLPSLGFSPGEQSWILNAFPIASIVGMFFSNQFADRKFAAEKFLAFSHLIGGLAILGCGFTKSFWPFFGLMLVHCLLYVPTISITNSIAFASMKNPEKEFGLVRVGGTIGWILAAWPFTFIFVDWAAVQAAHPAGLVDWLEQALSQIEEEGRGVLLYMAQEGRGIGLLNKLRAYELQEQGLDTVEANLELGFPADARDYGIGNQILSDLGLTTIRILTNNPKKLTGIDGFGLTVVEQVPIEVAPQSENRRYLSTKKTKLGHRIHHQDLKNLDYEPENE